MPFEDGTGPNGIGPTGWRRGPCRGLGAREMNYDSFRGYGRGFGKGFGYGFGRGFRGAGRFYSRDFQTGFNENEFIAPAKNYSKEEKIDLLKKEIKAIEKEINELQQE